MNRIRLLPVVILMVAALLVLKTVGLVTQGHYALSGVTPAMAAGGGGGEAAGGHGGGAAAPAAITTLQQPTLSDAAPTMGDTAPTLGEQAAAEAGGHGAPPAAEAGHGAPPAPEGEHAAAPATEGETVQVAEANVEGVPAGGEHGGSNSVADFNACAPRPVGEVEGGQLTVVPGDCPPQADAVPQLSTPTGNVDIGGSDPTLTEQVLLDRLAARRTELETYEQELALRASLIDAAEKRANERTATLEALEAQIATLVEERKKLEEEQFTAIVSMYQTMKPKDAAGIFNQLEIDILVRVAKMMSPRKMAPILAAMDTVRAQELTVRLASETSENPEEMQAADLAALPQIVGQ
ncbi:MotE family protein [Devosia riboflavina]|uniref:MotE family protein n=1 Tax=Devosia riboflavina TaxID=46914 RepID=UPI00068A031F|nr:MotE family protein [Devosia riboflavina]